MSLIVNLDGLGGSSRPVNSGVMLLRRYPQMRNAMNQFSGKLHRLLPAFLLSVLCFVIGHAQTEEKSLVLKNCTDQFGAPVDAKKSLFEINSHYVLELGFDLQDGLNNLSFFPKYELKEMYPKWKIPPVIVFLSRSKYADLLGRLDKISPKGELIKSMRDPIVNGFATYTLDQYEHAFLVRKEPIDKSGEVMLGSLYFFHEVEGRVRRKYRYNSFIPRDEEDYYYQVSVGNLIYFVEKEDYLKLRVGHVEKFLGVGPIEGICDDRNCNPLRQHNNSLNRSGNSSFFIRKN